MKYCKICFEEIKKQGFHSIIKQKVICQNCYNKFDVIYKKEKINNYNVLSVYKYNDFAKKLIYQFKGCYDIELKDVFLQRHLSYLKIKYCNYLIVNVPSSKEDDNERGFNHIVEIFSSLGCVRNYLYKKFNFKQSSLGIKDRSRIKDRLGIVNGEKLHKKKVLIVDDILTSGSSVKACIELIKEYKPKRIEILILCRNC